MSSNKKSISQNVADPSPLSALRGKENRAKFILNNIKRGKLTNVPEDFIVELESLAAFGLSTVPSAMQQNLKPLSSNHTPTKVERDLDMDDSSLSSGKTKKAISFEDYNLKEQPRAAKPWDDIKEVDLKDEHPAVIFQQFTATTHETQKNNLRKLSGETGRLVAMLLKEEPSSGNLKSEG